MIGSAFNFFFCHVAAVRCLPYHLFSVLQLPQRCGGTVLEDGCNQGKSEIFTVSSDGEKSVFVSQHFHLFYHILQSFPRDDSRNIQMLEVQIFNSPFRKFQQTSQET